MIDEKSDLSTSLASLKELVKQFVVERNWEEYHNPKDLAIAIVTESTELLDLFKWKKNVTAESLKDGELLNAIGEEVADVFIYLLSFSNVLSLDLTRIVLKKLEKNRAKYPRNTKIKW